MVSPQYASGCLTCDQRCMSLSPLSWHWHRLRANSLPEMAAHGRRKFYQLADARRSHNWDAVLLESNETFPKLPDRAAAPALLGEALRRDTEDILAGRWRVFGHVPIQVDDPPQWQTDYLVGKNL